MIMPSAASPFPVGLPVAAGPLADPHQLQVPSAVRVVESFWNPIWELFPETLLWVAVTVTPGPKSVRKRMDRKFWDRSLYVKLKAPVLGPSKGKSKPRSMPLPPKLVMTLLLISTEPVTPPK